MMAARKLWLSIQVLMAVIFLHHALQPLAAWAGLVPWKPKYFVALGGGFLYGSCLWLLLRRDRRGLWIAVAGPLFGELVLTVGALLMWLGVLDIEFRQDVITLVGGIPQVAAFVVAVILLRGGARRPAPGPA